MNERNYEYLKTQLKYTGFGENLNQQLREQISKDQAHFKIIHQANYGKDQLTASLQFSRSMQSEMYFFNNYKASLQKADGQSGPSQTFYIGREGANITLKEAYNLLDGRAVQKDMVTQKGNIYQAWLQLDFKQTTQSGNFKINQYTKNYGYDLISSLQKLPIAQMKDQTERIRLIESLQKGNRHSVSLLDGDSSQKVFIEANPQFKAIVIYDANYQRLNLAAKQGEKNEISENQSHKRGISR